MIRIGGKKGENSCLPQTKQQTAFVLSNVKMKQVLYELFRNVFRKTFCWQVLPFYAKLIVDYNPTPSEPFNSTFYLLVKSE